MKQILLGLEDDNRLVLEPPRHEDIYASRKGNRMLVYCTYNHSEEDLQSLNWKNLKTGDIIDGDGDSSAGIFTVQMPVRTTHFERSSLVFENLTSEHAGNYICEAKTVAGVTYTKTIRVVPLQMLKWNLKNSTIGGLLNGKITIDCGASGEPEPRILITDDKGTNLSGADFIIDGSRIHIPKLTSDYQGRVIKCTASQEFRDISYNDAVTKFVRLEVYFPPQFASPALTRYAIPGRNTTVNCQVTSSNPAVDDFVFYKNERLLESDGEKYSVNRNFTSQTANLTIFDVREEDIGDYQCVATNEKASSTQTVQLIKADPPGEVKVSYENARHNAIILRLEQSQEEQLPITNYVIQYAQKRQVETDHSVEDDLLWNNYAERVTKAISEKGLYEIGNLRNNTEYIFRISAENEAGLGDDFRITASTISSEPLNDVPKMALRSLFSWITMFALILSV